MDATQVHNEDYFEPNLWWPWSTLCSTVYSVLAAIAFHGAREMRCWIHNDGAKLEEEHWQRSFAWRGLGFSDLFFYISFFGVGLVLRTVSAGSLTRRCGRGESAVRGRAVGFRVGHGKGHWAGHWGRWRQQEGAWHFALAAPVWLQTTQIGSGGRHATIRRHGMKTGRSLGGQVQKNIHDGGRRSGRGERWWKEEEEEGGKQQPKEWCMWTASFMKVWKIIITTGFERSRSWSYRWEVPQGWSVSGGGGVEEGSERTVWLGSSRRWQEIKTMEGYSSTQAQHHQQQQHQTTKTSTKIRTAKNENRNTMTQHRAGMLDLKCAVTESFSCWWL